eukprot:gene20622-22657_t
MLGSIASRLSYELKGRLQNSVNNLMKGFKGELIKIELQRMIFDFKEPKANEEWLTISDKEFGGQSETYFSKTSHGQCVFRGNVSTILPEDERAKYSGFCAMKSKPRTGFLQQVEPFDLNAFDTFEIRLRGDGRTYFFNVHPEGYQLDDLYQAFICTRGGPYWEIVRIPYSKFILTSHGYLQDFQADFNKIRSFGFSVSDKKNGPFNLELDYIRVLKKYVQPVEFPYQEKDHYD